MRQSVPIRADGMFTADVRVNRPRGELVITVEQQDGPRTTRARATIDVVVEERAAQPAPR